MSAAIASSAKPVLYSYFRSSCSWRVRIALALKNIDYDYKPINLLKSEQRSAEYLEVNPSGKVPALMIDGHTLTESLAIIEYLDETRREPAPLLPNDPYRRAQARSLAQLIVAGIQPLQNLPVLQKFDEPKRSEWASHWIQVGFTALEKELAKTAGKYSIGDDLTIVDLALVPQVYNALRFKVSLDDYPTIKRLNDELLKLEAFRTSHPDHQPDTPPPQ